MPCVLGSKSVALKRPASPSKVIAVREVTGTPSLSNNLTVNKVSLLPLASTIFCSETRLKLAKLSGAVM
jgi:hypothetical protein